MNKRGRMRRMVEIMQDYWDRYPEQTGYTDYSDETFLLDALYGIGLALDYETYYAAQGFDRFKKFLDEFLEDQKEVRG